MDSHVLNRWLRLRVLLVWLLALIFATTTACASVRATARR